MKEDFGIKAFDAKKFSGELPLFPLPNTVLLPGQEMALKIFELRYRAMVQNVLSGEFLMALAHLKPGWEGHYYESPDIHPIVCIARIRSVERLDDGRFNLVVIGQERARIDKEIKRIPYRVGKVSILPDEKPSAKETDELRKWLIGWIDGQLPKTSSVQELFKKRWSRAPLGRLVDAISASLEIKTDIKYGFLEEQNIVRRIQKLKPLLKNMRLTSTVWKKSDRPPSKPRDQNLS